MAVVTQYARQTVSNESFDPNVNVTSRQSLAERQTASRAGVLYWGFASLFDNYCVSFLLSRSCPLLCG